MTFREEEFWARQKQAVFDSLKAAHAKGWGNAPALTKNPEAYHKYCVWKRLWWIELSKAFPVEFRKSQSVVLPPYKFESHTHIHEYEYENNNGW